MVVKAFQVLAAVTAIGAAQAASAQSAPLSPVAATAVSAAGADAEQRPPPVVVRPAVPAAATSSLGRLVVAFTAGTAFDSNIDHDLDPRAVYGGVAGLGVRFRDNPANPSFEVTYEAALHRYPEANQWDRLSQTARMAWELDLGGPLKFETVAEASLRGSSEDRELSNQIRVEPRLEVKLSSAQRLRFFTAYRVKRYPEDPVRNASNPMAGVQFRQRSPRGDSWEFGVRYDSNRADGARFSYHRWTTETTFATPLGPVDRLEFGLAMRMQRYPNRFVEVEDDDVPRFDQRWSPSVRWAHTVDDDFEFSAEYQFESRQSNDPGRGYRSHLTTFRVVQRW